MFYRKTWIIFSRTVRQAFPWFPSSSRAMMDGNVIYTYIPLRDRLVPCQYSTWAGMDGKRVEREREGGPRERATSISKRFETSTRLNDIHVQKIQYCTPYIVHSDTSIIVLCSYLFLSSSPRLGLCCLGRLECPCEDSFLR